MRRALRRFATPCASALVLAWVLPAWAETEPDASAPPAQQPPAGQPVSPDPAASPPASPDPAPQVEDKAPRPVGGRDRDEVAEVRVIGSRADALQRIPGSGTVIGAGEIQRAAPVDVAEVLRRVPGVQVREETGGGSRLDISVRGVEAGRSRRVLLLEDGIPISLNPYSEPDMYYGPPIERYRAIEVVKGSGNILFGPQTLAGTINFVTLAPPDRPTAVVDLDAGSYGYTRALASYGDTISDARYVVQVQSHQGDGFREQPFEAYDGLAKVVVPTGRDGEAMIKLGFHRDDAASDDVGLTSAMYQRDPRRPTLSPHSHLVLDRYDAALVHEQRFASRTKLTTLVYGYTTNRIWRRQDYTRTPALGEAYERIVGDTSLPDSAIWFKNTTTVLDREYGVLGLEPRLEHRVSTGSVDHTFSLGGRLLRETAHYQDRTGDNPESYSGSLDTEEKHASTGMAAYLQDRIALRPDLLVTPGIRVEHVRFRRIVLRQVVAGASKDVDIEGGDSDTGIIPGVGLVYGTKSAHVFGGAHVGYAPPRVTSAINPRGVSSSVSGDRSMNAELGTRLSARDQARLEVTAFASNFQNQVISNNAGGADTSLVDAGPTYLYGAESVAAIRIDRMLAWPTRVELGGAYTYSRNTFRYGPNAGNLLPYAPEHTGSARFDVEHAIGVGGQLAYTYVGKQYTDAADTVAEDATGRIGLLDPRHIVDATVHYRHRRSGISLRLTVKNALDTTYIAARRPEGIFTGPYRQVLFGVRWEWQGAPRDREGASAEGESASGPRAH